MTGYTNQKQSKDERGKEMLTKKDYEILAKIFKSSQGQNDGRLLWIDLLEKIADYLASDNPHFDKKRFLEAAI